MTRPVCLVTGSAGRLGTAICRALLHTYDILAVYRARLPDLPSQWAWPIDVAAVGASQEAPHRAFCVQADLTVAHDVRRLVEVAQAKYGRVDVLINSAADVRFHGRLLELCYDSAPSVQQLVTNCVAPLELISWLFQTMWKDQSIENGKANRCVINVSSVSGLYVYPGAGQGFYSASKAALNILTLHLASELAPYSVRANAICPARFPESLPVENVVAAVRELMTSLRTGEIVEVPRVPNAAPMTAGVGS